MSSSDNRSQRRHRSYSSHSFLRVPVLRKLFPTPGASPITLLVPFTETKPLRAVVRTPNSALRANEASLDSRTSRLPRARRPTEVARIGNSRNLHAAVWCVTTDISPEDGLAIPIAAHRPIANSSQCNRSRDRRQTYPYGQGRFSPKSFGRTHYPFPPKGYAESVSHREYHSTETQDGRNRNVVERGKINWLA